MHVDDDGRVAPARPGAMFALPGFVNAHSHAFQRGLRGHVERRSAAHPHDSFWTWRDAMYRLANALRADELEALTTWAYLDMLRAGFVAVGEFHYLHHVGTPGEATRRIAAAARRVGIRVVVLEAAYHRAGPGLPARPDQQRFVFARVQDFIAHVDDARSVDGDLVTHGLAIHSVRACPRDWIEAVAHAATSRDVPLHVHACEQRAELEQCRAEHGMTPIELLHACGALGPRTTIVHGTHLTPHDVELLAGSGSGVCLCPSTERNLGDGLCPIADLHAAGVPLSIGTDQHARIDAVDELRSVEEQERLRVEKRAVLTPPGGTLAHALLPIGARNGRRSLGLPPSIAQRDGASGVHDDDDTRHGRDDEVFVRAPLEARTGDAAAALDAWLVAGTHADVREVRICGRTVLRDGRSTMVDEAEVEARAVDVLRRVRHIG